jgi:hypothetical protein
MFGAKKQGSDDGPNRLRKVLVLVLLAVRLMRTHRMDDALVLNLALEEGPSTRRFSARKSGRWTDRCVGCDWAR